MPEHYVTLFDSAFLPQGIALHRSMQRHAGDHRLWVLAMDDVTVTTLKALDLPNVIVVPLADAETEELRGVRPGRTRAEYCWTLTPFTPSIVFERDASAERATYVDADMWLATSPAPILDELSTTEASVLITEHAYSREYEQSLAYGIYCVQFMPFVRGASDPVAAWWQERVIEWCFATPDAGRFGDQKYLDDWPTRFGSEVHVLQHPQWTQAPWNATRFAARDAITFHFHRLRTISADRASVGLYELPREHLERIYRPYLADLRAAYTALEQVGFVPTPQDPPPASRRQRGKDWLAFRLHNWRAPRTPYSLPF